MSKRNRISKKNEKYFHDEWASTTDVKKIDVRTPFEGSTSPEYKAAVKELGNVKDKRVLNIGCGLGEEAVYLALLGAKVTAIDLSVEMINLTKELAKTHKVNNLAYRVMDGESLTFKDEYFDMVLGCSVLHHANLNKMVKQSSRVLKKGGIAVFLEPLKYNPVINIYRKMANNVRTKDEHPLGSDDYKAISKHFSKITHKEYQFFTLLIFVWFYLAEGLHPNKVRYWKKIVFEHDRYATIFKFLNFFDLILLKIPFLRKYCWVTVVKCIK